VRLPEEVVATDDTMQAASATNENISPKAMKAIMLEIRDLTKSPIDGVRVVLNEECVTDVQADIDGPGAQHAAQSDLRLIAAVILR
jgi:ubiquitin-conjugating enzyme E2 S